MAVQNEFSINPKPVKEGKSKMPKPRNTTKYEIVLNGETVHYGITDRDLFTVQQEHQEEFPNGILVKKGYKTTRTQASKWRNKERKRQSQN